MSIMRKSPADLGPTLARISRDADCLAIAYVDYEYADAKRITRRMIATLADLLFEQTGVRINAAELLQIDGGQEAS